MSSTRGKEPIDERIRGYLLSRLQAVQAEHHHIPEEKIHDIADSLDIPVNEVYGVVSFYASFSVVPLGRHVIRVCQSVSCDLKDPSMIMRSIKNAIGISPHETTADGRFSLEPTHCIGACDLAPAMLINDDVQGHLTPGSISDILKSYA